MKPTDDARPGSDAGPDAEDGAPADAEGAGRDVVVAGVDGGGTRVRVLLTDGGGRVLGRGEGPGSLADPAHPDRAADRVVEAVGEAAGRAAVQLPLGALHAALAGTGRETTRSAVERALRHTGIARRVTVGTDVEATFADAFPEGPGILLLAGTGSVAWGRSEGGREARVGGWGSLLGDEGSGYAIGLAALNRVTRSADGRGPPTGLGQAIMDFIGLVRMEELVVWAHDATKADIARLVPVVVEAHRTGDGVAAAILDHAVRELESHVVALLETLGPWAELPGVALAGGLLEPGGALRERVREVLGARPLRRLDRTPRATRGAARRAREQVGG